MQFDSTDLIDIMLTEARIFNPWARSVVNSYIALRSFVFLFNSLIFYQFDIYHYYHSCLAPEFFTRSNRRVQGVFLRSYFIQFFPILLFLSLIRLEEL